MTVEDMMIGLAFKVKILYETTAGEENLSVNSETLYLEGKVFQYEVIFKISHRVRDNCCMYLVIANSHASLLNICLWFDCLSTKKKQ